MPQSLPWSSVWITGASSGIGLELARQMDGRGPAIAISARSRGELKAEAGKGASISAHPLDVTDAKAVKKAVGDIWKLHGGIDLAVLGAGVFKIVSPDNFDLDDFRRSIDVNYLGVVNCVAALIPHMKKRGSGHIAIIASVAGYRGLPKSMAYGPTKAALINFAEGLRAELEPLGIRVTVINPGFVDTPMTEHNDFPMPLLVPVEKAARTILKGLVAGKYEIVFPQPFAFVMKLLRRMPNALFFFIVRNIVMRNKGS
ncbi:MAG: SDR family NAD(P)-dependent oxidoreductase [Pseudomonadota bacterium]|nr:SDR family NAD(P)-dependent oxidoreductase [Pseudomonadota bacterium]